MRRVMRLAVLAIVVAGGWLLVRGEIPCELLAAQPACQVAMLPGPTEDTLSLVTVSGVPAYQPEGQLRLTTIAVQESLGFTTWLQGWFSGDVDVVPRSNLFPPGKDRDEVAEQNAALMADSQLTATVVALRQVGFEVTGEGALVAAVTADAVTQDLEVGDLIVAIDGQPVADSRQAVEVVRANRPGATVPVTVETDGVRREVEVTLGASPDDPEVPYVGVLLTTQLDLPVDVAIDAGPIGGPSAGLLFALSIVELLEPEDLTGGRVIAGTGTLDAEGVVGSVGGVRQKVVGAASDAADEGRASVFLVPSDNLADARRAAVDADLLLVPVDTLSDALAALEDLRSDREPRGSVLLAAGR